MKAISIKQPWAWAFLHGKDVENRNWGYLPRYRGPILIHASKKFDRDGYLWIQENCKLLDIPLQSFPDEQDFFLKGSGYGLGGFIAKGNLVDTITQIDACIYKSKWYFGPIGLVIKDVKPIDFIPYKGQLGIFNVQEGLL